MLALSLDNVVDKRERGQEQHGDSSGERSTKHYRDVRPRRLEPARQDDRIRELKVIEHGKADDARVEFEQFRQQRMVAQPLVAGTNDTDEVTVTAQRRSQIL